MVINVLGNFKENMLDGHWSLFYENGKLFGQLDFEEGKIVNF